VLTQGVSAREAGERGSDTRLALVPPHGFQAQPLRALLLHPLGGGAAAREDGRGGAACAGCGRRRGEQLCDGICKGLARLAEGGDGGVRLATHAAAALLVALLVVVQLGAGVRRRV
jgi:hypothetical protein